ncbi:MAG: FGGY-family carbohydrate kinase [Treponema sp.]|nr:FGGY-family carbohydrate kinase [Treponema sp.]
MLLTVDIGTSSLKSALWDYEGNRLSFASVPLAVDLNDGNKHETDCTQWLRSFESSCAKLGELRSVEAIVISGNGPTLVPVTGEPSGFSVPSMNARLWLDRRAQGFQQQVSNITGGFVDSSFFLPKILFIKNEENDFYRKVKYFLGCPEYLAFALTGQACSVFPSKGFDRWFWNDDVLEKLKLDKEKFPPFIKPGDQFGTITSSASDHLGFKKNIPVVSGGPDFFAAITGAGVTQPSQAVDRTGSSEGINLCTEYCIKNDKLMSYGHPVKPYWNLSGTINTTGRAVQWACDLLGISGVQEFYFIAEKSKPGSGGLVFLPYLAGERAPLWNPDIRASVHGLSLSSDKCDLANSILEGIAFAVMDVISVMEETGETVSSLRVTGGMAKNQYFNQIKADITGKEILEGFYKETELLGLAIIGSCFLGKYSSYKEAADKMVRIKRHFLPNLKNSDFYNELFSEYVKKRSV